MSKASPGTDFRIFPLIPLAGKIFAAPGVAFGLKGYFTQLNSAKPAQGFGFTGSSQYHATLVEQIQKIEAK